MQQAKPFQVYNKTFLSHKVSKKLRLDQHILSLGYASSIKEAQALILAGKVIVKDHRISQVGSLIDPALPIRIKENNPYVSRAGNKLAEALHTFNTNLKDKVVLDIGLATGGFSDCVLQKGAAAVLGVDVGYGQLALRLREDARMAFLEKTDAKKLSLQHIKNAFAYKKLAYIPSDLSICIMDVSFTSSIPIIHYLQTLLPRISEWFVLFKPQFEARKDEIEIGGIISNPNTYQIIFDRTITRLDTLGLKLQAAHLCSTKGAKKGNQEQIFWFKKVY